mmetsp:Transcript_42891/g.130514  ORF Transcript_42891/g.130514 Transcript_42891/m.130514 type:complete len:253 (+) Transcript_42891:610-1368(+)
MMSLRSPSSLMTLLNPPRRPLLPRTSSLLLVPSTMSRRLVTQRRSVLARVRPATADTSFAVDPSSSTPTMMASSVPSVTSPASSCATSPASTSFSSPPAVTWDVSASGPSLPSNPSIPSMAIPARAFLSLRWTMLTSPVSSTPMKFSPCASLPRPLTRSTSARRMPSRMSRLSRSSILMLPRPALRRPVLSRPGPSLARPYWRRGVLAARRRSSTRLLDRRSTTRSASRVMSARMVNSDSKEEFQSLVVFNS